MRKAKLAGLVLALGLVTSPAGAATVSFSQVILAGGDLTLGDEENQVFDLPEFDPSLGTLLATYVRFQGILDWSELFLTVASPGPLETISTSGSLAGLDEFSNPFAMQFRQGPTFHLASTTEVDGVLGFDVGGVLPEDSSASVSLALDAEALCSGCQEFEIGDTFGTFTGTLATTFRYLPIGASIPEPASWALLVVGLLGLMGRRKASRSCNHS